METGNEDALSNAIIRTSPSHVTKAGNGGTLLIRVCSTIVEPRYAPIGSKTDDTLIHYVVPSTIWNDPLCDCKGYLYRGKCSHITQVEENKCQWWTNELEWHDPCPNCGAPVVDFEMDPEYE